MGSCLGKKQKFDLDAAPPMGNGGAAMGMPGPMGGVNSMMPPMGGPMPGGPPGFTSDTGVMNNLEAPETMMNTGGFQEASVNFSNINDFRGDKIGESTKIQALRANSAGISGNMKPVEGATDDEYDSEYDTESASENEAMGPAPTPPERITVQGREPITSMNDGPPPPGLGQPPGLDSRNSYKSSMEEDFAQGIQRNPGSPASNFELSENKMQQLLSPAGVDPSKFNIESLSFNRQSVDGYGGNAVTRQGKSVVSDISGITGITGVKGEKKRKRVKRRRKKKKIDQNGQSVRVRKSKMLKALEPSNEVQRSRKKKRRSKNPSAVLEPVMG